MSLRGAVKLNKHGQIVVAFRRKYTIIVIEFSQRSRNRRPDGGCTLRVGENVEDFDESRKNEITFIF